MTCWICMKLPFVWRTRDDRKVCRVCARRLKKERQKIPVKEAMA